MSIIKVKTGGITADAITDALIADDVVGTEHLTANEVDTTALGADAVTAAQIADDAISEEHLDVTAITGHTAETSIADGDTLLIHDASASALRKMTKANFVSGVGETNKPIFKVRGSTQTISHNSDTKMTIDSEDIDTDNCFDLAGTKRFVPNKAGKYFFTLSLFSPSTNDIDYFNASVRKNNSGAGSFSGVQRDYNNVSYSGIIEANGSSDYFEAFCEQESGGNRTIQVTEFSAFYIGN